MDRNQQTIILNAYSGLTEKGWKDTLYQILRNHDEVKAVLPETLRADTFWDIDSVCISMRLLQPENYSYSVEPSEYYRGRQKLWDYPAGALIALFGLSEDEWRATRIILIPPPESDLDLLAEAIFTRAGKYPELLFFEEIMYDNIHASLRLYEPGIKNTQDQVVGAI
jgi:hypothetical protein